MGAAMTLNDEDLWPMLLSAIRYAHGRSSYIVGVCEDWVAEYGKHLHPWQREQIARETEEALLRVTEFGGRLGDECDEATWRRVVERLRAMNAEDA